MCRPHRRLPPAAYRDGCHGQGGRTVSDRGRASYLLRPQATAPLTGGRKQGAGKTNH